MGNCLTALVVIAVILTAACLIWCEPLLLLFGASPDTVGYGVEYLRIYACGTLFVQLALGMNAFITTQGFATTSMFTVLIGAVLNILLDPLFIFVFQMGVQGAALATILSQCVSALWVIRFLMGKRTILKLKRKYLVPEPRTLFPCLALGIAPFIMQSTESLIAVCFNTSLLKYGGDTAVGAMTILTSVMQFSMLPLMGLSQGAQPIVSYNYGAKDLGRVKKAFLYLLLFSMVFTTVLWSAVMLFPQAFASLFTSDAALMPMTVWAMRIYMAASLLFGVQISCQQTFIALGNAKTSMFLALLRKIILLIPLIYLLPNFFTDKLFAVFLSEPIADTLAVLVTATMFFFTFRKLEKSTEPPGAAG